MTIFGINITWTGVAAAVAAVVGAVCVKNIAGAYISKSQAKSELQSVKAQLEIAKKNNRGYVAGQLDGQKQVLEQYIDVMENKGFGEKVFGQYDKFKK